MSAAAETIGRYQIIREIARSNDIVYEGYDPATNRRVAVKELVFPAGGTQTQLDERLKRFQREAKAAGSLIHPNIVTIYEVGEDAGKHFIAMEYLEGRTLRERLDADGLIPLGEAVDIMNQVLDALSFAHQHGVIHRDIKPDNIQILNDGRVKLTDFGIARLTFEHSITMDGQVFGTPSYMSPEQVVGRDLDARTDIFSCGVVLYEMLTGAKPFAGDSVVTITYNICNTDPATPPGVHHAVEMVIRKAIEKSVALRYGSASEMASALKEAVKQTQDPIQTASYLPQGIIPCSSPTYPTMQQQPVFLPTQQTQMGYPPPPVLWQPPAPPRPLLSPHAKAMIGRIFLTFAIGVGMVGIGVGLVMGIGNWYEGAMAQKHDEQYSIDLNKAKAVADQDPLKAVAMMTKLDQEAQSDAFRQRVRINRAVFYEKAGQADLRMYNLAEAEKMFQAALQDDPTNPAYFTDMGRLNETYANQAQSNDVKIERLIAAAGQWKTAAEYALQRKDQANAARYSNYAADLLINVGVLFERAGQLGPAANSYNEAYEAAQFGSQEKEIARRNLDRVLGSRSGG